MTAVNNHRLLTVSQAAQGLGVTATTLRYWDEKGVLRSIRTKGRQRRYYHSQINNFKKQKDLVKIAVKKRESPHQQRRPISKPLTLVIVLLLLFLTSVLAFPNLGKKLKQIIFQPLAKIMAEFLPQQEQAFPVSPVKEEEVVVFEEQEPVYLEPNYTAIFSNLIPGLDGTYSLGTALLEWQDLYLDGTAFIDNALIDTATITTSTITNLGLAGNITVSDNSWIGFGSGLGRIVFDDQTTDEISIQDANLAVKGALTVTGTSHLQGNTTITGNLLPATDDTYSLGSSTQEWQNLFVDGTAYIDNLQADGISIGGIVFLDDGTAAAPSLSFTNDTNSGLYRIASDKLALATGATPAFVIDSGGQVGIGTTNPVQKLHVEGQCVTGDTLLPVATIISNYSNCSNCSNQTPNPNDQKIGNSDIGYYLGQPARRQGGLEIRLIPIKDIKGGEQVLSLDEETGKIVPAKIKGLLNMGVKPVYKLTTEDGRTIRTTGNHPYLVRSNSFLFPTEENQITGDDNGNKGNYDQINIGLHNLPSFLVNKIKNNQDQATDNSGEKIGIGNIPFDHNFTSLANFNEIIKKNPDITAETTNVDIKSKADLGRVNKGEIAPAENQATAMFPAISDALPNWPTDSLAIKNNVAKSSNIVNAKWTKVIYLQTGDEIAVAGAKGSTSDGVRMHSSEVKEFGAVEWQKIASIEELPAEQVYDIEVENTHNFIANGIVAHNTFINSSTATGTGLDIDANSLTSGKGLDISSSSTGFTGSLATLTLSGSNAANTGSLLTLENTGTLNTNTTFYLKHYAAGTNNLALRVDDESGDTTPFVIDGAGQVGIGTTGPSSKLDITTAGLGTTQTTTSGLALVNTTAAAAGAQQISPALRWSGFGWKTDATAGSQAVDFRSYVVPVQGTAAPTGYLAFDSSVNGGAYSATPSFVMTTDGKIGIGTTSPLQQLTVSAPTGDGIRIVVPNVIGNTAKLSFSVTNAEHASIGAYYPSSGNIGLKFNTLGSSSLGTRVTIQPDGNVGIGTTGPSGRLHSKESGAKTAVNYAGYLENIATNTTTDSINKYGLYLTSTGDFSGSGGGATTNYGLYLNTTAGADTNYDIYAASGANLSTAGVWNDVSSYTVKENFQDLNLDEVLAKIGQLPVSQWSYKVNNSVFHIGPMAEDFYSLFGVGDDDKHLASLDTAGVALAGIKALNLKLDEQIAGFTDNNFQFSILPDQIAAQFNGVNNFQSIIKDLEEKIATLEKEIQEIDISKLEDQVALLSDKLDLLTLEASTSAILGQADSATSSAGLRLTDKGYTIDNNLIAFKDLNVLGATTLSDLGVTGTINAGLLVIDGLSTNLTPGDDESTPGVSKSGVSIYTLSGPLKLQEQALGDLEIMGGLVTMDTKGNVEIKGNLEVEGKVKAKEFCIDDVCIKKEDLKAILEATKSGQKE